MLQFALKLALNRQPDFDNFVVGDNQALLHHLRHCASSNASEFLYLWGESGCGKSHLLMALCNQFSHNSFYLSLRAIQETLTVNVLEGLDQFSLVCLDDIDAIAGKANWEQALFTCYNKIRDNGGYLVVSARQHPRALPVVLNDLKSRLMWGACYQLQALDDTRKQQLLINLAKDKGITLQPEVASYMINRCPRETTRLLELLDELDAYSLSRQQQITIPLLRNWLQQQQL
jgi:DnaA family protein